MTPEEKVAMLKEAGVWDVIGYPTCIDKLFELVSAHEREKLMNVAIFSKWYQELDAAVLVEREACAKLAENWDFNVQGLVKAIRARGVK